MAKVRILAFGCVHIPFHYRPGLEQLVEFAKDAQPNEIICLGDLLDFHEFTPHLKLGEALRGENKSVLSGDLDDSIYSAGILFEELLKASRGSVLFYIPGNHEMRLIKRIADNLNPALDSVEFVRSMSLGNMIRRMMPRRLQRRVIWLGWAGDTAFRYQAGVGEIRHGIRFTHGDAFARAEPGRTVMAHIDRSFMDTCIAHSHRQAIVYKTVSVGGSPRTVVGCESGCLCQRDLPSIWGVPADRMSNWQRGFSYWEVTDKKCPPRVTLINIDRNGSLRTS